MENGEKQQRNCKRGIPERMSGSTSVAALKYRVILAAIPTWSTEQQTNCMSLRVGRSKQSNSQQDTM
jgi:hypothetical protein